MSERKVTIRICDNCGEEANYQLEPPRFGGVPFGGWVDIIIHGRSLTNHGRDGVFCGVDCAIGFLKKPME